MNISPLVTMSVMSCIKPNLLWLHNFYGHKIWREIFLLFPRLLHFQANNCPAMYCNLLSENYWWKLLNSTAYKNPYKHFYWVFIYNNLNYFQTFWRQIKFILTKSMQNLITLSFWHSSFIFLYHVCKIYRCNAYMTETQHLLKIIFIF